ncbi:MAG TPA: hypothetical protein VK014_02035, partial [Cyclobacteriaceae bacterium]|nr:hypothetical protein [Cyclobacteriaceae bacterium]
PPPPNGLLSISSPVWDCKGGAFFPQRKHPTQIIPQHTRTALYISRKNLKAALNNTCIHKKKLY